VSPRLRETGLATASRERCRYGLARTVCHGFARQTAADPTQRPSAPMLRLRGLTRLRPTTCSAARRACEIDAARRPRCWSRRRSRHLARQPVGKTRDTQTAAAATCLSPTIDCRYPGACAPTRARAGARATHV